MNHLIKLPSMGEGVHEATVVRWLKNLGDKISKGEPIVEVSTDKVDTEIVSTGDGYLIATFCLKDVVVKVDQLLAHISKDPNAIPINISEASQLTSITSVTKEPKAEIIHLETHLKAPASSHLQASSQFFLKREIDNLGTYAGWVRSSPLVRKLAKEYSVNLHSVAGTGVSGRITKEDFLEYISHNGKPKEAQQNYQENQKQGISLEDSIYRQKTQTELDKEYLDGVLVKREPMGKIRRLTAEHMLRSVSISPHVTTTIEVNLKQISLYKQENEKRFLEKFSHKLTYTAFFIYSAATALKAHPIINASVDGSDILHKDSINIACAVSTPSGLMVPVLKNIGSDSLEVLVPKFMELVEKTRNSKLQPSDVKGATFTITNPGMYGSLHSQPIISQPQVAIMSVGAIVLRPIVSKNGSIDIAPLCQVGLTFDHRIIDGEQGAKFLDSVRKVLEEGF